MKCLHILHMDKLSGAEKLVLILCKNMKKYEPLVVCGGDNLKSIFKENNIKSYSVDFSNKNIIKSAKELSLIIKDNDIKIVHAHDNNASIKAYLARLLYKSDVKIISHIHNCYPWLEERSMNKIIDSIIRKKYDHNIACGKLVYDYYTQHTDYIGDENTSVLSNAIDIDSICNIKGEKKEEIMRLYNIQKDEVVIGFIGRITEQKGIIPFIEEFKYYKHKFNNCKFILIGSGEQDDEVKELLKKYKLEKQFILTGHQDDVYKFYPLIDIFFLPSIYEGLPMVILEAMSFKKPIVSMNVGSIDEVVKNEYNGYLINQNDYKSFIQKLFILKNDEIKIKNYGENSLKIIKENYDIVEYEKNVSKLYDKVLSIE